MRKQLLFIFLCFSFFTCEAQQKITATKNKQGHLVGIANRASFDDPSFKTWFTQEYNYYKTDSIVIDKIKKKIKKFKIKGYMGTWCKDSRREVPRFYKILEQTGFDESDFELITVNRSKKTPDSLEAGFNIIRVPTFIFYRRGKEVGRFVEYPRESIEKDILKIISGESYKHSYVKD